MGAEGCVVTGSIGLSRGGKSADRYRRIYAVVARIPRGRVATYGQVARLAGLGGHARLVGYALSALKDGSRIPWHRVVNAAGATIPAKNTITESHARTAPAATIFIGAYDIGRGPASQGERRVDSPRAGP